MQRFKSILAVLTEDSLADVAFDRAIQLARSNDAALTLVDVVESDPGDIARMLIALTGARGTEIAEDVLAYHRGRLSRFAAKARGAGVEVTEAVLQGVPFVEVIRMVQREGHDIVIKGATAAPHGRGVFKGFDMHLLRKCPCPVWMLMGPGTAVSTRSSRRSIPIPWATRHGRGWTGLCSTSRPASANATARRCTWSTPGICRKSRRCAMAATPRAGRTRSTGWSSRSATARRRG
jgi:nucleotide-binding universal stress UspA family protein